MTEEVRPHPDLEVRRSLSGEGAPSDSRFVGPSTAVPDIYLIERAAIQLRRLRWLEMDEALLGATSKLSDSRVAPSDELNTLRMYARPADPSSSEAESVVRKLGMHVRAFFRMKEKS